MGFFNGKFLFGADFNDEDFTRDGKPKKKGSSDDAENTQELDIKENQPKKKGAATDMSAAAMADEQREVLMERIEAAENRKQKAAQPPAKASKPEEDEEAIDLTEDSSDGNTLTDEDILTPNQARIVSIVLFAVGILCLMAVLFKGSEGWQTFHNGILGLFGIVSIFVPFLLMYGAYMIGKKDKDSTKKNVTMTIWIVLICSAIQVFFGKIQPENGLGDFISRVSRSGADYSGGGIAGSFLSYFLISWLGRGGAIIVMLLILFVALLISTGKSLNDLFNVLGNPLKSLKSFGDSFNSVFGGDDDDFYGDEDDYSDNRIENASGLSIEMADVRDFEETAQPVEKPVKKREKAAERPKPAEQRPALSPQEQRELDEFSRDFDIPLPDDNIRIHNVQQEQTVPQEQEVKKPAIKPLVRNEDAFRKPVENTEAVEKEETELDRIIINAAKNKEQQDKALTGEIVETPQEGTQLSMYMLPGLELLSMPKGNNNSSEAIAEMNEKSAKIVDTFKSFGVEVKIRDIYRGPSITRYEIQPGVGVKVSKIRGLEDDIALSLAAQGVRLEAPVPGKAAVGIEVPNINKDVVTLREILSSPEFRTAESKLAFAVGKDITGNAVVGDITKMPHVIIAGTTGSGKSVCTRSIIMSILYKATPDEVKIILIDPKVVEFKVFEGIPHLLIPIVTEAKKAAGALNWAVNEMMRRYNTFADIGANDIKSYNEIADEEDDMERMPQIVIFIDELADMMLVAGKEVEDSICRLAQMGRAAGMHLVVATQRPTTDVITGLIKANIPSRIALSVMSQVDSRTIIDMAGADKLLGNGDMLYMPIGTSKPIRIQGCFASSKDISETLTFIRSQATGEYDSRIVEAVENYVPQTKNDRGASDSGYEAGTDEDLIVRAAEVAVNNGQLSTTMLQRKLKLGYARASRIMDELEDLGIVSEAEGSKPRKVLMSKMQFDDWKLRKLED